MITTQHFLDLAPMDLFKYFLNLNAFFISKYHNGVILASQFWVCLQRQILVVTDNVESYYSI